MTYEMHLHDAPFKLIKSGVKTVEMRVYDEKRRKIKVGDFIEFTSRVTGEMVTTEVISLDLYDNFEEMFKYVTPNQLGLKEEECTLEVVEQYYPKEEQELYGVVAINIKCI